MTTVGPRRQAPLKVDPATDELISQAAHFLGMPNGLASTTN